MAKSKNMVERIVMGDDDKPDLVPNVSNPSKWKLFKELFGGRFGTMVLLNLLTMIFCLPAIALMVYFYTATTAANALLPYSANIGVGYQMTTTAAAQSLLLNFTYDIMKYAILVPCIMVAAVGLSGNFYVMRKLAWGENVRTARDFFKGISKNWLSFMVLGMLDGLTVLLFVFSLGFYDAYNYPVGLKATCVTLSSILLVVMAMISMFWTTQTVAYKLKPMILIRNSILFSFGTLFQSLVIVAVTVGPVALGFIPGFTIILMILYVFLGISYASCAWTCYAHHCFDRFLPKENTAVYNKRSMDGEASENAVKQPKPAAQPVKYSNPKKKKKSIDEGAKITPLATTFNRDDLKKLEQQHKQVLQEGEEDPSSVTDNAASPTDDTVTTPSGD